MKSFAIFHFEQNDVMNACAGPCAIVPPEEEGAVRLVRGLGTPCDPLHTGVVEIFHDAEWGTICVSIGAQRVPFDSNVADTVCRQLGFPHGNIVSNIDPIDDRDYRYPNYVDIDGLVESEEYGPGDAWVNFMSCDGDEQELLECGVRFFRQGRRACIDCLGSSCGSNDYSGQNAELEVACRQFSVEEAAEAVVTPGAGALPPQVASCFCEHGRLMRAASLYR